MRKFMGSLWLTVTSLGLFFSSVVVVYGDEKVGIDQAKQWISNGENLSKIPKATWREMLTPAQFEILWEEGTERPFTGSLLNEKRKGTYVTAGCRLPVFRSDHKYDSKSGWPSFWQMSNPENIQLKRDFSWGMFRTEVESACGEHLGHVFKDGPDPTGLRYCINSDALIFIPDES